MRKCLFVLRKNRIQAPLRPQDSSVASGRRLTSPGRGIAIPERVITNEFILRKCYYYCRYVVKDVVK